MPSSTPPLQQFSALGRSAKLFYCLEMAILLIKQHCCWHSIGLRGVSVLPDSNCPVYQPHFAPIPTLTASTDNTTHLVNRKPWALRLSVLSCWDSNPGIASWGLQGALRLSAELLGFEPSRFLRLARSAAPLSAKLLGFEPSHRFQERCASVLSCWDSNPGIASRSAAPQC